MCCVHLLLLSFVVSPSVQPSLPPVSHSPAGTPPSAAVHAGIPHSCHTCVKKKKKNTNFVTNAIMLLYIIALDPLSSVTKWLDHKGLSSIFFPERRRQTNALIRCLLTSQKVMALIGGTLEGTCQESSSCFCQHNFTCHYFLLSLSFVSKSRTFLICKWLTPFAKKESKSSNKVAIQKKKKIDIYLGL